MPESTAGGRGDIAPTLKIIILLLLLRHTDVMLVLIASLYT